MKTLSLRWRPLIHARNAATCPQLLNTATAVEGWVLKDAESMGREHKRLRDYSN